MITEFSVVETKHSIKSGFSFIPEGTEGTVVYRHKDGVRVEVEFSGEYKDVLTLNAQEDICEKISKIECLMR